MVFILKPILSDISLLVPLSFGLHLHKIPFPAPHYQFVCFHRFGVGLLQTAYIGSCFCIHSASICLCIGAFNPFMFKVIIDKYDPLPFIILFWVCFYECFLYFLSKEDPLAFVEVMVW